MIEGTESVRRLEMGLGSAVSWAGPERPVELHPPASEADIAEFEAARKVRLPVELVEWFRIADGGDYGELRAHSLNEMLVVPNANGKEEFLRLGETDDGELAIPIKDLTGDPRAVAATICGRGWSSYFKPVAASWKHALLVIASERGDVDVEQLEGARARSEEAMQEVRELARRDRWFMLATLLAFGAFLVWALVSAIRDMLL